MTTRVERRAAFLRRRSPKRTERRRCLRCGKVGYYRPEEKACQQLVGLLGAYRCPGRLAVIARPAKPGALRAAILAMAADGNKEATMEAENGARYRAAVMRKLTHARAMVEKHSRAVSRAARLLRAWEGKARELAKLASLTDAEIAARRAMRKARPRRVRRAIQLIGSAP